MEEQKNTFAVVGLILGIACLVLVFVPFAYVGLLSIPSGIVGLILSVKGLKIEYRKGLAIAGMVLSIIGLSILFLAILCVVCAGAVFFGTTASLS